jgi:hypothetical protein
MNNPMQNRLNKPLRLILLCFLCYLSIIYSCDVEAQNREHTIREMYEHHCHTPSDINEHIPILCQLAKECSSVTEIGVRSIVSTWGILQGLTESPYYPRTYTGIDLAPPPLKTLHLANKLASQQGINFKFCLADDRYFVLDPTDMLFIDSLHTYCHLTYELENFSDHVQKYICLHDTSAPWGNKNDSGYTGDYSEYPPSYDRTKKGLWPAVEDFLARHPEWSLLIRYTNNHGFTILYRNP